MVNDGLDDVTHRNRWYTRWCPSSLAKLVSISPISLGLMNGGYIELVFMGIVNQQA